MFGYIKPFKPDLRIREYDSYKAVYCGLCGQMGESFGPIARLTLSYDFAFLGMLHFAVSEIRPVFETRRCYVNPLKKLPICLPGEILSFGADMASLMLYYKVLDNMQDAGGGKRILWRMAKPFAGSAHKKAMARRPDCEQAVAASMAEQNRLEAENCPNVDMACEPTAQAMAAICRELSEDPAQKRVLERIGYLIGRFVYLCDALDDLSDDLHTGSYNPFVQKHKLTPGADNDAMGEIYQRGREALYLTAGEAAKAYQLLDTQVFGSILDNVFYQGLRASVDSIMLQKAPKTALAQTEETACPDCPHAALNRENENV